MTQEVHNGLLISDFNLQNLAGLLNNDPLGPPVKVKNAPYGQVMQLLSNPGHELWQEKYSFLLVWTSPESLVPLFNRALNYEQVNPNDLLDQVDEYCNLLLRIADKAGSILVPTWTLPSWHRGWGLLDWKSGAGTGYLLARMNARLAENLHDQNGFYIPDANRWLTSAGDAAYNPKMYYMAKIPFNNPVFQAAASDIKSALRTIKGQGKKMIVLDLDDTLWGGIVGDLGWENIRLGGHDAIGEAFVDFQRHLKALTNRGIILGIVSKNEESIALEAISRHPEMVLRPDDFAGWRINWNDKAQNIVDLVQEVNLGLQSIVFIDDNPVERSRVREALPEVLVPEWPADKMLYTRTLVQMDCFDTAVVSREDADRSRMYVSERKRKALQTDLGSVRDWLMTLDMKVHVSPLTPVDLPRTAQLLNKTNQMNLTTRRMTESELQEWANAANHRLWVFRVEDKFGDSGLTGIMSMEWDDRQARIVDFILSCRVMGRQVEETMLHIAVKHAQETGAGRLLAEYLPTPKNKPCLQFFQSSGMSQDGTRYTWDTRNDLPCPAHIHLIKESGKEHD